ncbi:MAG TPA: DUF445 family protein [Bacillota bacterium]
MTAGDGMVAWLLYPAVGMLIGWLTNVAAVRLLFRPHRPVRVLGVTLQGVLPRRRRELADTIGRVIETELLRHEDLLTGTLTPAAREQIAATVARAAGEAALNRLPAFLPGGIRLALATAVRKAAAAESGRFTDQEWPELAAGLLGGLDIAGIIRERILAFDLDELERLAYAVARRELRHIEWAGAVLGGLVGLIQAALTVAIRSAAFH